MQKEKRHCDVLVVGGGAAGIGAAAGAARARASVLLLEKYGFMGGMATAGMVSTVCGFFLRSTAGRIKPVARGFVGEFAGRLAARQQIQPLALPQGLFILPYNRWHFMRTADETVTNNLVQPLLHTQLVSVEKAGPEVSGVECLAWNSLLSVRPKCVVDCTGEAVLVDQAGGETVQGDLQDASVLFRINGLPARTREERLTILRKIIHGAEKGLVHQDCRHVSFVPGQAGREYSLFNVPVSGSGQDGVSITDLELHGRRIIEEVTGLLTAESFLAGCPEPPVQIGIRSGRRAKGRDLLTPEQVLACRKTDDGVARGCWPMEIWSGGRRPEVSFLPDEDWYDIPAGCLVAADLENVFIAGRCLSADEKAMGSARVIGTALGTGYAAGTLAAFQARGKRRGEAVAYLQEQQDS